MATRNRRLRTPPTNRTPSESTPCPAHYSSTSRRRATPLDSLSEACRETVARIESFDVQSSSGQQARVDRGVLVDNNACRLQQNRLDVRLRTYTRCSTAPPSEHLRRARHSLRSPVAIFPAGPDPGAAVAVPWTLTATNPTAGSGTSPARWTCTTTGFSGSPRRPTGKHAYGRPATSKRRSMRRNT